jgi:hypothetical protein
MNVVCGLCERVRILVDVRWEMSALERREDVSTKRRWSRKKGGKGSAGSEREMCEISAEEGEGWFGGSGRKKSAVEGIFETSGEENGRGIQQPHLLGGGRSVYEVPYGVRQTETNKVRCHCSRLRALEVTKREWILRGVPDGTVNTRVILRNGVQAPLHDLLHMGAAASQRNRRRSLDSRHPSSLEMIYEQKCTC